jgi:hybrid cluster-associated redox disulfide protein
MSKIEEKAAQKKVITGGDLIADVVREYPEVTDMFLDFGIHCVGCYVSEFETIEQGILGHGFAEEELEAFLTQLNEAINDPTLVAPRV